MTTLRDEADFRCGRANVSYGLHTNIFSVPFAC